MTFTATELAALIEAGAVCAAPRERTAISRALEEMRDARNAELDSASSRSLRSMIAAHASELGSDAVRRLSEVAIYGVESTHINAIACVHDREPRIVVFDGLKHLIHFHTDLIKVLHLLGHHRPDAVFKEKEMLGERWASLSEVELFSMAGYSALSHFQLTGHAPAAIHDMLGARARGEVSAAFQGALCFVMLHELAHLELGHATPTRIASQRAAFALLAPEEFAREKDYELAADHHAISLIPAPTRVMFAPSLIFFLGSFAFLEAFSGNLAASHPLAINRLARLAEACDMSADERAIVVGWIEGQHGKWRELRPDRESETGSIRHRIDESMPISTAWKVIKAVKSRVLAEHGLLESDGLA